MTYMCSQGKSQRRPRLSISRTGLCAMLHITDSSFQAAALANLAQRREQRPRAGFPQINTTKRPKSRWIERVTSRYKICEELNEREAANTRFFASKLMGNVATLARSCMLHAYEVNERFITRSAQYGHAITVLKGVKRLGRQTQQRPWSVSCVLRSEEAVKVC